MLPICLHFDHAHQARALVVEMHEVYRQAFRVVRG